MSEFIQPRQYARSEAVLRQRRPGPVIEESERHETLPNGVVTVLVPEQGIPGVFKIDGIVAFFGGGMTASTPWEPVQIERSTIARELDLDSLCFWSGTTWNRFAPLSRPTSPAAGTRREKPQAIDVSALQAESQRRVQRLVAIQAALGLTLQDLAVALHLSRPQLYKWLDASQDVRLQEAKRQRLDAVERIAKAWQARSAAPLRAVVHEPLANGRTVFELLAADAIDEAAVNSAFEELTAKLQAQPKTRSQLLAEAGFKRRPSIRSLPSDE